MVDKKASSTLEMDKNLVVSQFEILCYLVSWCLSGKNLKTATKSQRVHQGSSHTMSSFLFQTETLLKI
jgi:hypothetical protein